MTHPLTLLSQRAIEYGAALAVTDPLDLAGRLYRYNSLPLTPAWRRRVPDERAAARLLELDRAGRRRIPVDDGGHRHAIWQVWDAADAAEGGGPVYKLYVSPRPLETAHACRVLRSRLGRRGGPFSIKVAADPASLLRPDRLVGYFTSRDACLGTARAIAPELARLTPLGVPFTAAAGRSALLSWAADPPPALSGTLPEGEKSWRGWVTMRLAESLADGASGSEAVGRLRSHGVDGTHWTAPWA